MMKIKFSLLGLLLMGAVEVFAQKEITVAAYNLRMDTPRDNENAWPKRKEYVKSLIKFHDFDIIGTQEGFKHQLKDILELPEYASVGNGRDDGKDAGEHSAIIYKKDRFKLLNTGNFWLSETPNVPGKGWDAKCCNRIATWAKFKDAKSKKTFFVFNVHFDHEGVIARKESGKLMVEKIKEIAKGAPSILTGDFNSEPNSEQMQHIASYLKDSYTVTKDAPYGPVGTFSGFKFTAPFNSRIDYVFVSPSIEVLKYGVLTDSKDQKYPSDHAPVVTKIKL